MLNYPTQIGTSVETSECIRPNPSVARSLLFESIFPEFNQTAGESASFEFVSHISLNTDAPKFLH